MVHHDPEILPLRQLDQLLRLLGGGGERFLDEHVLAVFQGDFGQIEVRADGGHHGDGVDLWGGQQVVRLPSDRQVGIRLSDPLKRGRTLVTGRGELTSFEVAQISDDVRPPINVADNAWASHGVCLVKI